MGGVGGCQDAAGVGGAEGRAGQVERARELMEGVSAGAQEEG